MDRMSGYPQSSMYQQPPMTGLQQYPEKTEMTVNPVGGMKKLTNNGFVPLSKEEQKEAERIAAEASFSFEGYQVVRREFFSHRYDPTLTIKGNSISFNKACISRLDEVVYVQVLVNPDTEKLVVRPCPEGARDAIRWCVAKNETRKSRQITCGLFTAKLYELMGWEALYHYKLQGSQITYQGEQLYVFDLTSTEIYLPQTKDPENPDAKPKRRPPVYPADWRDSFGMPVAEHTASTQIDLMEGYTFADDVACVNDVARVNDVAQKNEDAPILVEAEVIDEKTSEVL